MNCKVVNRTDYRTSDIQKIVNDLYHPLRWNSFNPDCKPVCVVAVHPGDNAEPELVANTLKGQLVVLLTVPKGCSTSQFVEIVREAVGKDHTARWTDGQLRIKADKAQRQREKMARTVAREKKLKKNLSEWKWRMNLYARRYNNTKKRIEKAEGELEKVSKELRDLRIQQPGG